MYDLYILYSEGINQYYVGHSNNLEDRLERHNAGKSISTTKGVPWELKASFSFDTRSEAMKAEKWVKSMKSRRVIEKLISGSLDLEEIIVRRTPVPMLREGREFPPAESVAQLNTALPAILL